jgi:excinuclease ABC A subunit
VINVDQSPIGRTPRSNPATYTGLLTPIRELFAGVPEFARARLLAGALLLQRQGRRCEACQGDGMIKVEMHFLPDIFVPCDVCHGKRYNRETLEVRYKGKTIHEVLQMTVEQAHEFFDAVPVVARKLQTLLDVGLGYIQLGQSATTLSGGEAQRVKLALELSKRDTGRTLYILDEPTTGLHFQDIEMLLSVLHAPARPRQHRGGHRAQPGRRSRPPTGSSTSAPKAARRRRRKLFPQPCKSHEIGAKGHAGMRCRCANCKPSRVSWHPFHCLNGAKP